MTSKTSEMTEFEGIFHEGYFQEESNITPFPSSADSCVTSTLSCIEDQESLLKGDFQMTGYLGLPQLTFGLIKPDGMKYLQPIQKKMRDNGFTVVQSRRLLLSPEQISQFYKEHYGKPSFPMLVAAMCEGPVQVFVLQRKDAVQMWKLMCGPTCVEEAKKKWPNSLRALYGTPGKILKNVCHAADSEQAAREEIRFFFPRMTLDDNFRCKMDVEKYLKIVVNPVLSEGLMQVCRNKPVDPVIWLGTWLLKNNPFKPKVEEKIALAPT